MVLRNMVLLTESEIYYLLSNADVSMLYILHNKNVKQDILGYVITMYIEWNKKEVINNKRGT